MGKDVLSKIRAGDVFKALERVLEAEGIEEWTVEDTRPHPSFVFEVNGWQVRFHFPCTPMTRGNTQRRCSSRLRTGIQSLYMEAGHGREIEIDKHTAADVDNGRLRMEQPGEQPKKRGEKRPSTEIMPFAFEGHDVRVAMDGPNPWFMLADVCSALNLASHKGGYAHHAAKLDEDEKRYVARDMVSGTPMLNMGVVAEEFMRRFNTNPNCAVWMISESGVYTLILRCRDATTPGTLPHRFRRFVTSEVLPSIRATGVYVAPGASENIETLLSLVPQIVEQTIRAVVPAMVKTEVTSQQGYAIVSGITAGEVVAMAGVADRSGLRGVINAVSTSLCEIHRQRGVHVPHPRHGMSSAKMFDPAVCRDWLATGGRDFIRRRVQETRGQTAMVLRIADQREPIA